MAKAVCLVLGFGLLFAGSAGIFAPGFMHMHLSVVHTIIHFATGVFALFFGFTGTKFATKIFCFIFGATYATLGILGFVFGHPGAPTGPGPTDDYLWRFIPGGLELGLVDHIVHIALGVIFLIGGFMQTDTEEIENPYPEM